MSQTEFTRPGPLLNPDGSLAQIGWARQPILECNLENASFYPPARRWMQRFRIKRWDYYALFTPTRFFSATIADLGYAANLFVYTLDYQSRELHEEGLVVASGSVSLPRNSTQGESIYKGKQATITFHVEAGQRQVMVDWPAFHNGRGIRADLRITSPDDHESMAIVIPIRGQSGAEKRFYYNRKINCLPAEGLLHYGDIRLQVDPTTSLASLDWGRGVWEYRSYWNWASTSGFLPDGRRVGLNLGCGFGDTSAATEDALILEDRIHKLGAVKFQYEPGNYMKPWQFSDGEGRLSLIFTPFIERVAKTSLLVIDSEVHQMFGRYSGQVIADDGEIIQIENLVGFAEEHHARW